MPADEEDHDGRPYCGEDRASDNVSPPQRKPFSGYGVDTQNRAGDNGGYARASYASGGSGASRVPRIAGDVTAGPALVSCVLVSYAPCAERRRF
jgi:hypothetical protein